MSNSTACLIIGYCLGISMTLVTLHCTNKPTQATQQPEPCICPTYEDIASWTASYEVYNDSLNYGRKADKSRYQDSVNKFKLILKIK